MKFTFCTYFDQNYLARGLVMMDSLLRFYPNTLIWVLCLDEITYRYLNGLKNRSIYPLSLKELESHYPELTEAKKERTLSEYYFTLSPFLPRWILSQNPNIGSVTYIDSDIQFFASPITLLDEIQDNSIGITEHRFHKSFDQTLPCGRFNVGWVYFKRDEIALKCLTQWSNQCVECCTDKPNNGKFADQKYLDSWPDDFENVHIFSHPGANLAPWNVRNHRITLSKSSILSDSHAIIFYHFHMIRLMRGDYFYSGLDIYHVPIELRTKLIHSLYIPYLMKVKKTAIMLKSAGVNVDSICSVRNNSHIEKLSDNSSLLEQKISDGEIFQIN